MATIPLILSLANEFDRLSSALTPYYNYWPASRPLSLAPKEKYSSALIGKDGFQVSMDVTQFKPNELNVKVVDNCIVVEGKHEEREDDHGYISRHFVRRYALPKGYEANKVMSTLSSDGVLTVSAPKPQLEDKSNERVIQIQQTGPAHLNIKDNPQENNDKDNDKDKEKDKKAKK